MTVLLDLKNISKTYQQGEQHIEVLKDLNFVVKSGETVAILGQSGSGKSTMLALMAGLDQCTAGEICFAGTSLKNQSQAELTEFRAGHLGIVFQQFHLIPTLTALENVELPLDLLPPERLHSLLASEDFTSADFASWRAQRALNALDQVGLSHRREHLPSQLSGGECQRVAIARALIGEPQLILADEPSGNLDDLTGDSVMDVLFDLVDRHKHTLLLVTHNEKLAQRCQRQVRLVQGRLE